MIQATELRIGNWVMNPDDDGGIFYFQISGIANSYIAAEFIPITEEILLKAGFEKMPLSSVQRYRSTETLFFIQLHKKEWFIYGYKYYPNGIKYLHELQNLFYILVGRELTITL